MKKELVIKLIDQASELGVPSMKFNWRGEPLLHPQLPDFIVYAKKKGILETIINTNATKLDETYSKKLIDSGLDLLIFLLMEEVKKLMKNFDLEDLKKIDLKVFIKILLNSVNKKN